MADLGELGASLFFFFFFGNRERLGREGLGDGGFGDGRLGDGGYGDGFGRKGGGGRGEREVVERREEVGKMDKGEKYRWG